jgi:hypothetical protein
MSNTLRATRRALERELQQLGKSSAARFEAWRQAHEKAQGRMLIMAELGPVAEGLADPVIGQYVQQAVLCAYGAAQRLDSGSPCECFICRQAWSDTRSPVGLLRLSLTNSQGFMLSLICDECVASLTLRSRISQSINEGFFGAEGEWVPASALVREGGHG